MSIGDATKASGLDSARSTGGGERWGEGPAPTRRLSGLQISYQRNEHIILPVLTVATFLTVWELVPSLGLARPVFTSSPTRILKAAQWLFAHGLWHHIRVSTLEFTIGYALAAALGIPLGILLGWHRRLYLMFDPFVSALYALPRSALLPILILWLGIGIKSKIAIVFLGAFFPILVSATTGVHTIDEMLLRCARSFGASDRQVFLTLALPSSLPYIVTGMRLGVGRGLAGVVVGELLAATAGIGYMMSVAGASFQTDKVYVGVFVLAAAGYILTELLKRLEARFETWRPERR